MDKKIVFCIEWSIFLPPDSHVNEIQSQILSAADRRGETTLLLQPGTKIPVSCVTHVTRERSERDTGAERP